MLKILSVYFQSENKFYITPPIVSLMKLLPTTMYTQNINHTTIYLCIVKTSVERSLETYHIRHRIIKRMDITM